MLIRYKPIQKKIAMGLISYMPKEKDIKKLKATIERYDNDERWQLYLWKEEDIIGVLGLYLCDDGTAELRHLSVNPSYRQEGVGKKMISALKDTFTPEIRANEDTMSFFEACQSSHD